MNKTISIIGSTSSGKSTLCNLIALRYVMPSGVQETTLNVVELKKAVDGSGTIISRLHGDDTTQSCFESDNEAREHLNFLMTSPETSRSRLKMSVGRIDSINSNNTIQPVFKTIFLNQYSRKKKKGCNIPWYVNNFSIMDFPGFKHEKDKERLKIIQDHLDHEGIVICVIDAEETNLLKEKLFFEHFFREFYEKGGDLDSIIFVMNKKDVFYRDKDPKNSLLKTVASKKRLIMEASSSFWNNNEISKIKIIPFSAGIAFPNEMIFWNEKTLTTEDYDFLVEKIETEAVGLLPADIRKSLSRSFSDWSMTSRIKIYKAVHHFSGLPEFAKALNNICLQKITAFRI